MAQACAGKPIREDMKSQALSLYRLAGALDGDYLNRRIAEETSNEASLETLSQWLKSCEP
jgi:hypothetical protein